MNALAMMTTTANASLKADYRVSEAQLGRILTSGVCPPQYRPALSVALTESSLAVIAAAVRQSGLNPVTLLAFDSLIGGYPPAINAWLAELVAARQLEVS